MGNACVGPEISVSPCSSSSPRATKAHIERIKYELREQIREDIKEEIREELKQELKQELKEELKEELRNWLRLEQKNNNNTDEISLLPSNDNDNDGNINNNNDVANIKYIKRVSSLSLFDDDDDDEKNNKTSKTDDSATVASSPVSTIRNYKEILEELGFPVTTEDNLISSREWKRALLTAVRKDDLHAVEVLLDFNRASTLDVEDEDTTTTTCIVDEAIERKNIDIAKALSKFDGCAKSHLLVEYSKAGNVEKMNELLTTYRVNPDSVHEGVSALRVAIRGGHLEAVELLIKFEASTTDDCSLNDETTTHILLEALEYGHVDIAQFLVDSGVDSKDMTLAKWTTKPCGDGIDGIGKWAGVATCNNKLYFCPCDASQVLVFDIENGNFKTLDCGIHRHNKWVGIASFGNKLFCAPHDAEEILVINSKTEQIRTISLDAVLDTPAKKSRRKWNGIIRCGTQLYCAPYTASSILMIDGETERLRTISVGSEEEEKGERKWAGIANYDSKLFFCPANASSVMVFNTKNESVYHIPLSSLILGDDDNENKWGGIVRYGTKLFFTPCNASSILVLDGDTEQVRTIPCGIEGDWKWSGIDRFDTKLVSAPFHASSIMIIDGDTEEITFRPSSNNNEKGKWHGIVQCGKKLVCSPFNSEEILILEDYRSLLTTTT